MPENLVSKLIPHQGCTFTRKDGDIEVSGAGQNWIMSAAVLPQVCRAPFVFRVVCKTDSTNLRMHWHKGELIFNWEVNVRDLRVHDPAGARQEGIRGEGFITPGEWHEIVWEIRIDRMKVTVDGEVRYEGLGDYGGIESAPSVGPCFGSTITIREFQIYPPP